MPNPLLFLVALLVGGSYEFSDTVTPDGLIHLIWKGAGVGLLAVWAATVRRTAAGGVLTIAFVLYAAADVAIEFGMVPGAVLFITGHAAMTALYWRHRGLVLNVEDRVVAGLVVVAVPLLAFALPDRRSEGAQVAVYAVALGAMAASAWLSGFRRDRVALGAALFVLSDVLIFAQLGPLRQSAIPGVAVWPLYFAGQALIVAGIAPALAVTPSPSTNGTNPSSLG